MSAAGRAAASLGALIIFLIGAPTVLVSAADSPTAAGKQPSAASANKATRTATAPKISVKVLLNSSTAPDEYLVANGQRYVYFNSPGLVAPTRPLAEPVPRYPQGKGKGKSPHGAVLLQLLINEGGTLDQVSTVCTTPAFEKSAIDSVKGIRFAPAQGRSGPVKSFMFVEFGYGRGYPCGPIAD